MVRRLHIGGKTKSDGWEVLNANSAPYVDHVCNANDLAKFADNTFSEIYASHIAEHLDYHVELANTLKEWNRVLVPGGKIFISVPDLDVLAKLILEKNTLTIDERFLVMRMIFGGHVDKYDYHFVGLNEEFLTNFLSAAGYVNIKTVGAFNLFNDTSSMLFKGVAISLNMVAEKRCVSKPNDGTLPQTNPLDNWEAYKKRGNEFLAKGMLVDAAACYKQAISINPNYAEGLLNLGFVLNEQKLYEDAEHYLKRAILVNPKMEDAYYILGTLSQERGNLNAAIENFNNVIEINPEFDLAYRDLCHVLFLSGQIDDAKSVIQKGIALNPENAEFHGSLGNLYVYEKKFEKAIACYRKALSIQPDFSLVYSNMGKAFVDMGSMGEAAQCYQKALLIDPDDIHSESCLLFIQSFNANCLPPQYLAEAKAFGSKVMARARPYTRWHASPVNNNSQALRVGLVSGDLRNHPVGFFLESILACLNSTRFELVAYPTQFEEDELTARIKSHFSSWSTIAGLSDESAARKIHEDGIHILIDLSGHTSYNRLPVFAWKPAPVQVSWLGYLASTGVPGMDYVLADPVSVPEFHREHFSEMVWYLPDTVNCLTPPAASAKLAITPPPAVRNGYITFGSFQNITKVNDEVLALWGRIFHAMPQARLRFHSKQMSSPAICEQLQKRLARFGIQPERVTIKGAIASREDYLATHAEVDVILDTFPYPGITTTCEALWMGVPTITLAGDTMLSRQGASLLTCAGLDEWVAYNKEEYVALAHSTDVNRLAQLRSELRQQVLDSTLFNAPRFALHLEAALQGMWQQKMSGISEHTRIP